MKLHAVWSGHNQQASSLQSMLNFFMGLLRKRGEKIFVILCSGGHLPPSSYASAITVTKLYTLWRQPEQIAISIYHIYTKKNPK